MPKTKMITIPFKGPIYPKAGAYGPLETPYFESVDTILTLLNGNYPVEEVLADGTKVPLTFHNYNKDNAASAPAEAEQAPVAPTEPVVPVQVQKEAEGEEVRPMSKKERRRLEQAKQEAAKETQADGDLTIES